jgi:hypothetical protein
MNTHPVIFPTCNRYSPVSSTKKCLLNPRIMHRFLTGLKRKPGEEPKANNSSNITSTSKSLKKDESYLSFGFTRGIINSEEQP